MKSVMRRSSTRSFHDWLNDEVDLDNPYDLGELSKAVRHQSLDGLFRCGPVPNKSNIIIWRSDFNRFLIIGSLNAKEYFIDWIERLEKELWQRLSQEEEQDERFCEDAVLHDRWWDRTV